jgi:CubicO group peptidase (beta-lactamase class C family)
MPQAISIIDPRMNGVDALVQSGLEERVFPGAVLLVGHRSGIVHHRAYGCADLFSGEAVTCHTVFDLASLTKPLATTLAVLLLVQQGVVDLDRPLMEMVPDLTGDDKKKVTLRHLLSHCSGLPPTRPYYFRLCRVEPAKRMDALKRWVRNEPLLFEPGAKEEYSDVGFMLLQWLVEDFGGLSLDRFVMQKIYRVLDGDVPFFMPLYREAAHGRSFAATELCPWRGRLLKGQVHDDNAYAMGGIAGHAGLFATAQAVFGLMQWLLDADAGEDRHGLFETRCIRTFFQRQRLGRFALGFDMPSLVRSSAGQYFSPDSIGHLGYSGTSVWADRRKKVIVVLLTNRVHPTRFNPGIKAFRPLLHDAVMTALKLDR